MKVLADGICRALKPVRIGHRLFGRENFDEAFRERIKPITVSDVTVQ